MTPASEISAENEPPFDYVSTGISIRWIDGRRLSLVIPKDVNALEGTCFSAFIAEWASQYTQGTRWDLPERLKHYGLERFLVEGDKT